MMDDGLIIIFNSNLRFLFLVKQMTKWPDLNLFAFWYKAKEFDVGYRMESEHDGQTYEVVLDSRNRPRWKRISQ